VRSTQQDILELARRQGVVTPADVRALGLAPENLNRMSSTGLLVHVARGIYEHPDLSPTEHHSYVEVAKSVPKGVICLISALSIHGIGTQMPWEVWVAIPRGMRIPRSRGTRIRAVTMTGLNYELGIEQCEFEGIEAKLYSVEKTIVDCFRLRRLVGHDVPVEALREGLRGHKIDLAKLLDIAQKLRARSLIQPYVEALI
jgi:predicted transcriptional regulator of viral defense system